MKFAYGIMAAAALTVGVTVNTPVSAQVPTCDDIEWSAELLARFPNIRRACEAVVVRDGQEYARFTAQLERRYFNGDVKLKIMYPDGTHEEVVVSPPDDFRAKMGDNWVTFDQIPERRNLPFRIYIPEGRWQLASVQDEGMPVVIAPVTVEPVEPAPTAAPILPATGGPLPLLGLLGGLFVALGGAMTFLRRR
ncbi:MAG: hypothetical protein P8080_01435 [Gammaproteobacteria bacterium]